MVAPLIRTPPLYHWLDAAAEEVNVTLPPEQRVVDPVGVIVGVDGNELTVNDFVAVLKQVPLLTAYTTVTVPAVRPVTIPPGEIFADPVPFVIDHEPPGVASVKAAVVELTHTVGCPPPIAETPGNGFTVTIVEREEAEAQPDASNNCITARSSSNITLVGSAAISSPPLYH